MTILRSIVARVTAKFERRGEAAYEQVRERDPDIRGLRLQRRQSERAERRIRSGNLVSDALSGNRDGRPR